MAFLTLTYGVILRKIKVHFIDHVATINKNNFVLQRRENPSLIWGQKLWTSCFLSPHGRWILTTSQPHQGNITHKCTHIHAKKPRSSKFALGLVVFVCFLFPTVKQCYIIPAFVCFLSFSFAFWLQPLSASCLSLLPPPPLPNCFHSKEDEDAEWPSVSSMFGFFFFFFC